MEIEDLLSEIERFFEGAAKVSGIKASYADELEPKSAADIASFAEKHGLDVPDDVRRFWQRGFTYRPLSFKQGETYASAGFDWLSLETLERDLPMFRGLAQHFENGSAEKRLYEQGLPLNYSEPQLVFSPGEGISHAHSANPLLPPVTRSFTEFLEHWLEAGCFSTHSVGIYLPKVRHLVPGRISPDENLWLLHYKKEFPQFA
jgi:hypothetical protein